MIGPQEMNAGFTPIRLDEYIELHLRANPDVERADLIERLRYAMAASQRGERCQCGRPIWIIGSAEVGLSCFTCITGESHPDRDYEIEDTEITSAAEQGRCTERGRATAVGNSDATGRPRR